MNFKICSAVSFVLLLTIAMAPSAILCDTDNSLNGSNDHTESAVLHRNIKQAPPVAIQGTGNYLFREDGRRILDTAGGAAVRCLGYDKSPRIDAAIIGQLGYIPFHLCSTNVAEELARFMVDSTHGEMSKFCMYNSGSESMDAAVKLAVQYHQEKSNPEPGRINFISREGSYHGNTGFSLSLSGHQARRGRYEPLLQKDSRFHYIPAVYPYRDRFEGESDKAYIKRKAKELEDKIVELGPETVAAYAMEPVVGATLGSVDPPKGYLKAIDEVCKKYGVLVIFDEVMCGMGRTGTLHAWQREGVAPDIQAVGKSLAGGYAPASGILVGPRIADALYEGSGIFIHGHTYQNHGIACAATLEVQKIIQEYGYVENSREMGELLLGSLRQQIGTHAHVGDIRGPGLFVTIEFVQDKATKECFPRAEEVVERISKMALNDPYNIHVYTGCGEAVPIRGEGDHIMIAPAFTITEEEIHLIVDKVSRLINDFPFHSHTRNGGVLQTPFTL